VILDESIPANKIIPATNWTESPRGQLAQEDGKKRKRKAAQSRGTCTQTAPQPLKEGETQIESIIASIWALYLSEIFLI